jgi:hypothetical protein
MLDVDVISITDATGQPLRVERENKDNGWTRGLRIWIPGASDADRQVIIRYRVANAIRFYYDSSKAGGFDEVYWNVTGNSWTMPIDRVHTRVQLPDGITPTRTAAYTGARGSIATDAKIEKNGSVVDFTLSRRLSPYEGITIGVGWPAGYISSRPSEEPIATDVSSPAAYVGPTRGVVREPLPAVVQWSPLLIPFVVFYLVFKTWQKRGRDPKEESTAVRYEPVEGASPAELGTLVDNTANIEDVTATLVDLAVRGFIRIEEKTESHLFGLSKSTDYILHLIGTRSARTSLKPHEERYLAALSSLAPIGETSVKISDLQDKFYTHLPKIRSAIYDNLVSSGYYLQRPDKVKGKWIAFAALIGVVGVGLSVLTMNATEGRISPVALIGAVVISTVIMLMFAVIMPARTIAGARAREAALGFKEFLTRVESERYRRMITSPEMFERYLPFAMAFGVGDEWARAFEDIYREPPNWYVGGSGQFSAINFASSISNMSSVAASSMSSSPSSSGSGGGGSSGGGSGGGGGSGF